MKVMMLTSMSGPNVQRSCGEEIDVSDAEGAALIRAGFAQPVRSTATETTARKRARETTSATSDADQPAAVPANNPDASDDGGADAAGGGAGE
ncbi:hypothetical protein [Aminobacter sp. BE322]|uniref:hypothetical protein n=1 Tax=unclassified Aminobacter TaxID=2644704 RepID=UPI003D1915FA